MTEAAKEAILEQNEADKKVRVYVSGIG